MAGSGKSLLWIVVQLYSSPLKNVTPISEYFLFFFSSLPCTEFCLLCFKLLSFESQSSMPNASTVTIWVVLTFKSVVKKVGMILKRAQASIGGVTQQRWELGTCAHLQYASRADNTYITKGTLQLCFTLNLISYLKFNWVKLCFSESLLGEEIKMCYYE